MPHGLAPLEHIRPQHFAPPFAATLKPHRDEIDAIVCDPDESASVANSPAAIDRDGNASPVSCARPWRPR
jgi:hypothetical protein